MAFISQLFQSNSTRFYTLIKEMSGNIKQMNQYFVQFCYEHNIGAQKSLLSEIEELEHKNDDLVRTLITYLSKTLTPPFDREDIHLLITTMDDIADYTYYLAKQRIIYSIKEIPIETQKVAEKLQTVMKMMDEVIAGLSNRKEILKLVVFSKEISNLLHECDTATDDAMNHYFAQKRDIIETIKLTDHYIYLQTLITKYMETIEVINTMIIKYS